MVDVSIIIVSWNTRDLLAGCLESLTSELKSTPNLICEVVVIDNASTDGSAAIVQTDFPWVRIIENANNVGFAAANNQGAVCTEGRYILLLNPDTRTYPGLLTGLTDILETIKTAGAIGPCIYSPDGNFQVSAYKRPTLLREFWRLFHLDRLWPFNRYSTTFFHSDTPKKVDILDGACILIRRDVFNSIGFFDEQFFVYSEEYDLCMRMQKAGWEIYWHPLVEIVHFGGQSTIQNSENMFVELYRNKIRLFRKHYGSMQTKCYKILIWLSAMSRIFGARTGELLHMHQPRLILLAQSYRVLIKELPQI